MSSSRAPWAAGAAFLLAMAATDVYAENGIFSGPRADTVPEGRLEVGLIEPTRYGLSRTVEISAHPLAFFAVPHLGAKIAWHDTGQWRFSTRHRLTYPSLALEVLASEGPDDWIRPEAEVPQLVTIDSEIVLTTTLPLTRRFITVAAGLQVAPRFSGEPVALEAPLLYARTAVYRGGYAGHATFTFSGEIAWDLTIEVSASGYVFPGVDRYAAEQTGWLGWQPSESWRLRLGIVNSTSWYPDEGDAQIMPLGDLLVAF